MKKLLFALTALVLVSIPCAPKAYAGGPFDVTENYYSSSSFSTGVGWYEQLCDDTIDSSGTFTDYRYVEVINCTNHHEISYCQVWNPTTSQWDDVECPPPTNDGRLRIPVGAS